MNKDKSKHVMLSVVDEVVIKLRKVLLYGSRVKAWSVLIAILILVMLVTGCNSKKMDEVESAIDEENYAESIEESQINQQEAANTYNTVNTIYDFHPFNNEMGIVEGNLDDGTYFSGLINQKGELTIFDKCTRLYPISDRCVLATNTKRKYYPVFNCAFTMVGSSGKLMDLDGNILVDNNKYIYFPTTNNRVLVFALDSDISGKTLSCGVMDGNGQWIKPLDSYDAFSDLLNAELANVYENGSWYFKTDNKFSVWSDGIVVGFQSQSIVANAIHCGDYIYLYDSRDDSFHKFDNTAEHYLNCSSALSESDYILDHIVCNSSFEEKMSLSSFSSIENKGFVDLNFRGNYYICASEGLIYDYKNDSNISVSQEIAPYLTYRAVYVQDGFICFLKGNDGFQYYAKIDMNGNSVSDIIKLEGNPELHDSSHHIIYDNRMITMDEDAQKISILDINSGEVLKTLSWDNNPDYLSSINYLNNNLFVVEGKSDNGSVTFSIFDIDGECKYHIGA